MGNSSFIRILCRFESKEEMENDTEDIFFFPVGTMFASYS